MPVGLILNLTITTAISDIGLAMLHEETRIGWVIPTTSWVERVRWEENGKRTSRLFGNQQPNK